MHDFAQKMFLEVEGMHKSLSNFSMCCLIDTDTHVQYYNEKQFFSKQLFMKSAMWLWNQY